MPHTQSLTQFDRRPTFLTIRDRRALNTGDTETWDVTDTQDTEIVVFVEGRVVGVRDVNTLFSITSCFYWDCRDGLGSDPFLIEYQCNEPRDAIVRSFRRGQFERAPARAGMRSVPEPDTLG